MSLNPYYTGIHLHIWHIVMSNTLVFRHNPYYTGIHLHSLSAVSMTKLKSLNPYYTGIHLHWVRISGNEYAPKIVLILIILEYIYIFIVIGLLVGTICLNPYYTGIHLHKKTDEICNQNHYCLNPYYTGIHLHN